MSKKYDEVVKLPCDKLAQAMSDITYCFRETKVPKSHYKKVLEERIEEDISSIFSFRMLGVFVETLKQLNEESPKLFYQALLCIDNKLKPNNLRPQEIQALNETYKYYEEKKLKNFLDEEILSVFEDIEKNGSKEENGSHGDSGNVWFS